MPRRENCRQDALTMPLEFFVRGYSGCCGCTICHYHFLLLFSLFFAGEFCWPPRRGHWCALRFHPIYSGRQACGRTSRGHTGGRSHSISHPPSFCGACLNFSRGKDSAVQELKKKSSGYNFCIWRALSRSDYYDQTKKLRRKKNLLCRTVSFRLR